MGYQHVINGACKNVAAVIVVLPNVIFVLLYRSLMTDVNFANYIYILIINYGCTVTVANYISNYNLYILIISIYLLIKIIISIY